LDHSRINNRWPMAREGIPFIIISAGLLLIVLLAALYYASVIAGLAFVFVIYFFRDPERTPASDSPASVLTPADGRILEIVHIPENHSPTGLPAVKISIFMSVFNVHVNRMPLGGTVQEITYHPGRFLSANLDKASKENERNEIAVQTTDAGKIVVVQIAGLIARRIACWVEKGDHVKAGQRFGLIRFGSRVEVYLPPETRITVQVKQRVRAGETVMGYLRDRGIEGLRKG